MKTTSSFFFASAALCILSACGGGGDSPTAAATPVVVATKTFSLADAYKKDIVSAKTAQWTVAGTVTGVAVTGSGTTAESALTAVSFNGAPAQSKTTTYSGTVTRAADTRPLSLTTIQYFDANFVPVGSIASGTTGYITAVLSPLPTAAKAGDTGTLGTVTTYSNPAKTVKVSSATTVWTLLPDTADTVLVKLATQNTVGNNPPVSSTKIARIQSNGEIALVSEEADIGGGNFLTFTFQ